MSGTGTSWPRRRGQLALSLLIALLLSAASPPVASAAERERGSYFIALAGPDEGDADRRELANLVASLRRDYPNGPRDLMLLVHGYDTRRAVAEELFDQFARRFRAAGGSEGTAVVGISWGSDPGPARTWLSRSAARKVMKAVGLGKRAPRDPYDTVSWRAQGVGRRGLRRIAFALQETFPKAGLHLVAHSLGARVAMNALAPDLAPESQNPGPAFAPGRDLLVDSVVLAGADLDANLFLEGEQAPAARAALPRSRLWWFTVADPDRKDRVLKVRRRHVGKPAIGNVGPEFTPEDAQRLLRDRRLVIDMEAVPRDHHFESYYRESRLRQLAAATDQLAASRAGSAGVAAGIREREPGPRAQADLLARVAEVMDAAPTPETLAPYLRDPSATVRLYAAWRLDSARPRSEPFFQEGFTVKEALRAIAEARDRAAQTAPEDK